MIGKEAAAKPFELFRFDSAVNTANGIRSMSAASMPPSHIMASHRAMGAKTPSSGKASQAKCTNRAKPQNVAKARAGQATFHVSARNTPTIAVNTRDGMKTVRKLIYTGISLLA